MGDLGGVVDPAAVDRALAWVTIEGLRILLVLVVMVASVVFTNTVVRRWLRVAVVRMAPGRDREELTKKAETLAAVVTTTTVVIAVVLGGLTIMGILGIDIGPLLAGAGVAGIAIGFGAQSLVRDLLSGLFILLEGQFYKGDVVRIAGISGVVEDFSLRRTVLRDLDGTVHNVPNGEIKVASNLTSELSRVNVDITVDYAEDLDRVIPLLDEIGKGLGDDPAFADVIREVPHVLRVESFGQTGVTIKMVGVTKPGAQWSVTGELRRRVKVRFDQERIQLGSLRPAADRATVQGMEGSPARRGTNDGPDDGPDGAE